MRVRHAITEAVAVNDIGTTGKCLVNPPKLSEGIHI
jgi:hypothetical protein